MPEMFCGTEPGEGLYVVFESPWATIHRAADPPHVSGPRYVLTYRGAPRAGELRENLSEHQADFAKRGSREAYGVLLYARALYQGTDPCAPVGTLEWYKYLRVSILLAGYTDDIPWSETLEPPKDAVDFWRQYTHVVINSGMRFKIAQAIYDRVRPTVEAGGSAATVFGHKGKAAGIDLVYARRSEMMAEYLALDGHQTRLAYLLNMPWIGPTTQYHLAKNLGEPVSKPDRHLERVVGAKGFLPVQAFCEKLAQESGDRVATVDLVIWRAAIMGIHQHQGAAMKSP